MSLKMRLHRAGAKKRPFYRIVVAEATAPRDGRFLERVGSYNPMVPRDHEDRLRLNEERIKHWLGNGAQPTDRVRRFLGDAGLMEKPGQPQQTKKNQPKAKAQERLREQEAARAAAEKAAAEAAGDNAESAETTENAES